MPFTRSPQEAKARVFVYIEYAPSIPPFAYQSILAETSYKQKKNGVGTKNVCIGQPFAGFVPEIGTRMRYRSLPARDLFRYSGDVAMLVLRVERYRGPRLAGHSTG